ncbi:hypothetical protein [Psychromicrobium sp. YIM B11713]|uniref:hypothetical protein n=1 Tax=Psychromicrobium sp. YIM B11713 TaxID=3145233 RepID=UPI00374E25BB
MTRPDPTLAEVDMVDQIRAGRDPGGEGRSGQANLSNGPVLVAGLMAASGLLFAGWAFGSVTHDNGELLQALGKDRVGIAVSAAQTPKKDSVQNGMITVTLSDVNHNGIPDAFEDGLVTRIDPATGKPMPAKLTETPPATRA